MILLADPHLFIVQETNYRFDAEVGAKSQALAQSRFGCATDLLRAVIDERSYDFLDTFIAPVVSGIV
jgi:hypothetical protein